MHIRAFICCEIYYVDLLAIYLAMRHDRLPCECPLTERGHEEYYPTKTLICRM